MLVDVKFVLNKLVPRDLLQIGALATQMRQTVHDVLYQMEAVKIVLHPHIEGRSDRAFFLVPVDMNIPVGPAIGQPVHQPGISVKAEDDLFVLCKERVVVLVAQSMRMFGTGLQSHEIDDIDHPDFQIGEMMAQDGNGSQDL